MSKVSEYRQHARECRSFAKTARFSQHRKMHAIVGECFPSGGHVEAEGLERIAQLENAARKSRKRS
jgi:hypothetical protein